MKLLINLILIKRLSPDVQMWMVQISKYSL